MSTLDKSDDKKSIGFGAYARVYLLKTHDPPAVIKLVYPRNENYQRDFERECDALAKLSHPNIVQYFGHKIIDDFGEKRFGILMEFCERGSLRENIFNSKLIYTMLTVCIWAQELFTALAYLCEKRIIHRDIKPENVLVDENYRLKLGDFGCVKISEKTCDNATLIGTYRYMSPEIYDSQVSPKSDIYSTGLVLWEIIERRRVFSEYGAVFNQARFLDDVIKENLLTIEKPSCEDALSNFVIKCASFQSMARPNPSEALFILEKLIDGYKGLRLAVKPFHDETQTFLIRPIGFDGTKERLAIHSDTGFSIPPANELSIYDLAIDQEPLRKNYLEKLKIANVKVIDMLSEYSRSEFKTRFSVMTEETQDQFVQQSPEIQTRKEEELYIFKQTQGPPLDWLKSETLEALFEAILEADFHAQFETFVAAFSLIEELRKPSLNCLDMLDALRKEIEKLSILKEHGYTKRFHFECFVYTANKDEWFLLENEEFGGKFMRKDLAEVRTMNGEWTGTLTNGKRQLLLKKSEHSVNEKTASSETFERMCFVDLEPFDVEMVIAKLNRQKFLLENFAKLQPTLVEAPKNHVLCLESNGWFQLLNLPLPDYVFQLRNPPKFECRCGNNCEQVGKYPGCTSKEQIAFGELFMQITKKISFLQRKTRSDYPFTCEEALYTHINHYPNEQIKYMVFFLHKHENDRGQDFLLLDHPENYLPNERLPCLDRNYKFFTTSLKKDAFDLNSLIAIGDFEFFDQIGRVSYFIGVRKYDFFIPQELLLFEKPLKKYFKKILLFLQVGAYMACGLSVAIFILSSVFPSYFE